MVSSPAEQSKNWQVRIPSNSPQDWSTPGCGTRMSATGKPAGHSTIGSSISPPKPRSNRPGNRPGFARSHAVTPPVTHAVTSREVTPPLPPHTPPTPVGGPRPRPRARRRQAPRRAPTALAAPAFTNKSLTATSATTTAENPTEWSATTSTDDSPPPTVLNKSTNKWDGKHDPIPINPHPLVPRPLRRLHPSRNKNPRHLDRQQRPRHQILFRLHHPQRPTRKTWHRDIAPKDQKCRLTTTRSPTPHPPTPAATSRKSCSPSKINSPCSIGC